MSGSQTKMQAGQDQAPSDKEKIYSRNWEELINGLCEFSQLFKDVTSPIAIITSLNSLVADYDKQKQEAAISRKMMQAKEDEIVALNDFKNRFSLLESENRQLKENCDTLRNRCNILEHENCQYQMEISCRNEALLNIQNSIQATENMDYPEKINNECKQLNTENQFLKEQLAKCHQITVEMQQKYLKPDLSDKLKTLQEKCTDLEKRNDYLQSESKQLNIELSCKHDAVLCLADKDRQLEECSEKIKDLENKCHMLEQTCKVSPTDERLDQLQCDKKKFENQCSAVNAEKIKELKAKVLQSTAVLQLELKQLEEEVLKQSDVSANGYSILYASENMTEMQQRYDMLEVENKELLNEVEVLNEKLGKNYTILNTLSGKISLETLTDDDNALRDRTVILKQKDERKTYGIWFGRKRGPLTTRESKFFITKINNTSVEAKKLKVGDFVIEMNGVNIQQASTAMVNHILKNGQNDLTLVVRDFTQDYSYRTICGSKSNEKDEWGITFGVFVKDIHCDSFARKLGFHEYDEILKVNNQLVSELSLNQIYHKMNKFVRFELQRFKDELFNLPDIVVNQMHLPSIDDEALDTSEESLYVTSDRLGVSTPVLSHPIQTASSRNFSFSTSVLCNNRKSLSPSALAPKLNVVSLEINKGYKSFGWKIIGGNSIGIFISEVSAFLPASDAGIQEGWKLLRIDSYSLENVALGFAHDIINSLQTKEKVHVVLEKTHDEHYREIIKKEPHDCFHIKSIMDYDGGPYSFKSDQIFCVYNSFFIDIDERSTVRWKATVNGPYGRNLDVVIPNQHAKILHIQEEPKPNWRRSTKKKSNMYYEILDDVDISYTEEDDLLWT